MKKVLTLFAALMLLASASFAQTNARRMTAKDMANISPAAMFKFQQQKPAAPVTTPAPKNVTSFPWTEDFESGTTPTGFTFVDNDNDGLNWDPSYLYGNGYGHNGSDGLVGSASWDPTTQAALTPDNWMILPAFDIPAGSDFELTWYEKGQDQSYFAEFYSVYINTTGNAVTNFTATTAVLTSTTTGDWVKKTVSLASYAGQTIYIAFRHHNVTDMFYLDIDDMRIGAAGAPEISISGPAIALMNQPATFTATSSVNTLTWYVDGNVESATGLTLTTTFTTAGTHEVVAEATNAVGSAYDTLEIDVVDCGGAISTFPYVENFEAENPCWQFVSADPANDDRVGITTEEAIQGSSSYVLSSYSSATSEDYNQFLISPEFELTAGTDYIVKFWYLGYNSGDAFRVKVSTTTADTAAFTTVLADFPTVATSWTEVAYTLPAGTKYIAINYYGDYMYYLYIDNFSVEEMGAPIVSLDGPVTIGTNSPATFTATASLADTLVWYVDGQDANNVGDELTYTFTTAGDHEIVVEATNTYGSATDTFIVNVIECNAIDIPHNFDLATEFNLCWDNPEEGWDTISMTDGSTYLYSMSNLYGFIDLDPDNWIYTPTLTMPAEGSFDIAWKVAPYTTELPSDHYGVYIVQGNNATLLREETLNASMNNLQQRVVSIPASVSGDFKIAFRHYETTGGYVILLGDIKVVSAGSVVSIDDVDNINVAVYPNPVSDVLNIRGEGILQIELMDVNGRTVMTSGATSQLNLSGMAAGLYMVRVITNDGIHTQKIVKK